MPLTKFKGTVNNDNKPEASLLQKQLGDMDGEVQEIQMELAAIKRDRIELCNRNNIKTVMQSKLREELIRAKNSAEQEKLLREKYEARLKDLELKLNIICCSNNEEAQKISDEEVTAMKTQIRDYREEMEELRMTVVEKNNQLQEYRVKYLQAQQQVEESRRQLDVIEFDNKHVSDQIQMEIQKMKLQFQEKLQELIPLPDLLKGAQIQLQEAKKLQRLAEDSGHQLSNELHRVKEKFVIAVNNYNQEKADKIKLCEENKILRMLTEEKQKEIDKLIKKVNTYESTVLRIEEKLAEKEKKIKEKSAECSQILKDLDEIRKENNRTLARTKERADSMRRYLQTQISELERQLVQSRAVSRASQKERDEIRQLMQIQVNNLKESFELAEIRLRTLQNQVASLKRSYTIILADDDVTDLSQISAI